MDDSVTRSNDITGFRASVNDNDPYPMTSLHHEDNDMSTAMFRDWTTTNDPRCVNPEIKNFYGHSTSCNINTIEESYDTCAATSDIGQTILLSNQNLRYQRR